MAARLSSANIGERPAAPFSGLARRRGRTKSTRTASRNETSLVARTVACLLGTPLSNIASRAQQRDVTAKKRPLAASQNPLFMLSKRFSAEILPRRLKTIGRSAERRTEVREKHVYKAAGRNGKHAPILFLFDAATSGAELVELSDEALGGSLRRADACRSTARLYALLCASPRLVNAGDMGGVDPGPSAGGSSCTVLDGALVCWAAPTGGGSDAKPPTGRKVAVGKERATTARSECNCDGKQPQQRREDTRPRSREEKTKCRRSSPSPPDPMEGDGGHGGGHGRRVELQDDKAAPAPAAGVFSGSQLLSSGGLGDPFFT